MLLDSFSQNGYALFILVENVWQPVQDICAIKSSKKGIRILLAVIQGIWLPKDALS